MTNLRVPDSLPLGKQGPLSAVVVQRYNLKKILKLARRQNKQIRAALGISGLGPPPIPYGTSPLAFAKTAIAFLSHQWHLLTPTQQAAWSLAAMGVMIGSWKQGIYRRPSGFQYYMHLNRNALKGSPCLSNA
ncbi:MAG: hypothetical protein ACRD59_13890, partial [Candidatus Acidiferrales bacterium]